MAESSIRGFVSTGPWRQRVRWAVRLVTPWGIEWMLWIRSAKRARQRIEAGHAGRPGPPQTGVEEAVRFLVDRGLDELQVRQGSMPESSLTYLAEQVADVLPSARPLRALQVGNFVGVSLACISWLVTERHPESVVVSIDPNISHRGIDDPQSHTLALLDHFQLLSRNVIITGYTLERQAAVTEADNLNAAACENVLAGLRGLGMKFDLVIIDGDHHESYLAREIAAVRPLLADSGILILDDITEWPGVNQVFNRILGEDSFELVGENGRVGIVQLCPPGLSSAAGAQRSSAEG